MGVGDRCRLAAVLLLISVPLAGCLGDDGGTAGSGLDTAAVAPNAPVGAWVELLTDPEGDAYRNSDAWARTVVPCLTVAGAPAQPATVCEAPAGVPLDGEPPAGLPGSPPHDILGLEVREAGPMVEFKISVAGLAEDLSDLFETNSTDYWTHEIGWADPETGCTTRVLLLASPLMTGPVLLPYVLVGCPDGPQAPFLAGPCTVSCFWRADVRFEPGTPGAIVLSVPRQLIPGDDIVSPEAAVTHYPNSQGVGASRRFSGILNGDVHVDGSWYAVDRAATDATYALSAAPAGLWAQSMPLGIGPAEAVGPATHDRNDVTIRALNISVAGDQILLEVHLAQVDAQPSDLRIDVSFGVHDRRVYVTLIPVDGAWQPSPRLFTPSGTSTVPVSFQVRPGSPGSILFRLPLHELVPHGGVVNVHGTWVNTRLADSSAVELGPAGDARTLSFNGGAATGIAPLARLDVPVQAVSRGEISLADPVGDLAAPPDLLLSDRDRFDLVGAEFTSIDPGEFRATLLVQDLSDRQVPTGYDAVFTAAAVRSERGTTMLGHYRSDERPGGQFFCAPDAVVFEDQRADPALVDWQEIRGAVNQASTGGGIGGGEAGLASLVFFAPGSCFGIPEDGGTVNASALRAGTYLIRRGATTEVLEIDSVEGEEAALIPMAVAPATPSPFWQEPFGVENFWDIAGIIVAILTVAVTAAIFYRRRRVFHAYIDQIRAIHEDHAGNPTARAEELVALRRRLHQDLEGHRISDSHYPIVLDRLRARLTSARLTSLGAVFYDLPPHLAMRIERLLDDGHLSHEESRVVEPLIQASRMAPERKDTLLSCLQRWAHEDQSEGAS